MSTSVIIDPLKQAMVRVALARLRIAVSILESDPDQLPGARGTRALDQLKWAIDDLETNLPFTVRETPNTPKRN